MKRGSTTAAMPRYRVTIRDAALILVILALVGFVAFAQIRSVPHALLISVDDSLSVVQRMRQNDGRLEKRTLSGVIEAAQHCVRKARVVVEAFAHEADALYQQVAYDQTPQDINEVTAAVKPLLERPAPGEGTHFSTMLSALAGRCDEERARNPREVVDVLIITDTCLDLPHGSGKAAMEREIHATIQQATRLSACKNLGKVLIGPADDYTARSIATRQLFKPLGAHLVITSSRDEMVTAFKTFGKGE